jgi:hypothetical protein
VAPKGKSDGQSKPELWIPSEVRQRAAATKPKARIPLVKEKPRGFSVDKDELLYVLAAILLHDPRRLYNEDGSLIDLTDLDEFTAFGIQGIKVFDEFDGGGEKRVKVGQTREIRTADRIRAAELMAKLRGWMQEGDKENRKDRLGEFMAAIKSGPVKKGEK